MKKILLYMMIVPITAALFFSCDGDKYETFVDQPGYSGNPTKVENLTGQALPGEILLKWDVPADSSYYFVRIKYYDHYTKEEVTKIVSVYTDELLIPNTRKKYGDYEFKFQAFNNKNEGGEVITFKTQSGIAPTVETITTTKVALTVDQLSSNAAEPNEGPIKNLIDGNSDTFFHTRWSGGGQPWPHWLDVHLNEPVENFRFYYQNRSAANQQSAPTDVDLYVSNDGSTWTFLEKLTTGLPLANKGEYTSNIYRVGTPFTYFRFSVNAAMRGTGSQSSWNMAEFAFYDVKIDVYDPEDPSND